jgi:hypothetical protein
MIIQNVYVQMSWLASLSFLVHMISCMYTYVYMFPELKPFSVIS